ncbi:CBS domain-containing protein [Chitinispirillales bacterium ANBcel5]|uniref:CBS domain-containing protein n=1 Tax=Cellulosispirillum alkaliphilum TaxID=3039283 RepID=UPI002A54153F|nr:CBS domain-containing protein [Chitinispirillales bacterium ANBcel5]
MDVFEIMTRNVDSLPSNYTVLDAAKKMRTLNVGVLPVTEEGHVVGMITDRDIVVRAISEELNPGNTSLKEVMSREIFSCKENADIAEAAKIMEERRVRRLLVQNNEGSVTGIISLGDIATHVQKELSGEILQQVSEPSFPRR